jgi:hypothetical protein
MTELTEFHPVLTGGCNFVKTLRRRTEEDALCVELKANNAERVLQEYWARRYWTDQHRKPPS